MCYQNRTSSFAINMPKLDGIINFEQDRKGWETRRSSKVETIIRSFEKDSRMVDPSKNSESLKPRFGDRIESVIRCRSPSVSKGVPSNVHAKPSLTRGLLHQAFGPKNV